MRSNKCLLMCVREIITLQALSILPLEIQGNWGAAGSQDGSKIN